MVTTDNTVCNFPVSCFLAILQKVNMVANGNIICVLVPSKCDTFVVEALWRMEFQKNIQVSLMTMCICQVIMNVCCGLGGTKSENVKYGVVKIKFRCGNRRNITAHRLCYMSYRKRTFMRAKLDS